MRKRVLITGGGGFIGHSLIQRLSRRRDSLELVAADTDSPRLPAGAPAMTEHIAALRRRRVADLATLVPLDVRDPVSVTDLIHEVAPSVVVHLAAVSVAEDAARERALGEQVNVTGLRHVLDALAGRRARLVFVSSSFVYGDFESPSVDESHPLRPSGAYGVGKFRGEEMVRAASALDGQSAVIVRPSAVYGPYDSNGRIVQRLLEQARKGVPGTLRGAGSALDFTYVDDLAAGLDLAAFHPRAPGRTFNLTAGRGRTLRELADILRTHFPGYTVHEEPADPDKPKRGTLDIGHARRVLGYRPCFDLESGIERYAEFYRSFDAPAATEPLPGPRVAGANSEPSR
ncbi:hypothetical protein ADL21_12905 [Streptomyces albus subsp. albus]|nr:hypothetical protein ADL21_12905 [Streptomyces albus subsp. albus]